MKNAPLRFDGMSLHHNPHKLHIENRHHIRSLSTPTAACDSLYLNRKPCVISGEGELYGADCLMQYQALYRLYRSRKRAKLALPQLPTMYAYLRELQLLAEPEENVLTYRFVFAEAQSPRLHEPSAEYYFAEEGESLWNIAYSCGVAIDALVRLNPQIPHIDDLAAGERVKLC